MPFVSADTQFSPAALPNDGSMDMIVTDSNNSVWKLTSILLAVESGKHIDDEKVHHTKVLSYRLIQTLKMIANTIYLLMAKISLLNLFKWRFCQVC